MLGSVCLSQAALEIRAAASCPNVQPAIFARKLTPLPRLIPPTCIATLTTDSPTQLSQQLPHPAADSLTQLSQHLPHPATDSHTQHSQHLPHLAAGSLAQLSQHLPPPAASPSTVFQSLVHIDIIHRSQPLKLDSHSQNELVTQLTPLLARCSKRWSPAQLSYSLKILSSLHLLTDSVVAALQLHKPVTWRNFSRAQFAAALNAMHRGNVLPAEKVRQCVLELCAAHVPGATLTQVVTFILYVAQACEQVPPSFLQTCEKEVEEKLPHATPRQLLMLLRAVVRAGHQPSKQWLSKLAEVVQIKVAEFDVSEVAEVLKALHALHWHPSQQASSQGSFNPTTAPPPLPTSSPAIPPSSIPPTLPTTSPPPLATSSTAPLLPPLPTTSISTLPTPTATPPLSATATAPTPPMSSSAAAAAATSPVSSQPMLSSLTSPAAAAAAPPPLPISLQPMPSSSPAAAAALPSSSSGSTIVGHENDAVTTHNNFTAATAPETPKNAPSSSCDASSASSLYPAVSKSQTWCTDVCSYLTSHLPSLSPATQITLLQAACLLNSLLSPSFTQALLHKQALSFHQYPTALLQQAAALGAQLSLPASTVGATWLASLVHEIDGRTGEIVPSKVSAFMMCLADLGVAVDGGLSRGLLERVRGGSVGGAAGCVRLAEAIERCDSVARRIAHRESRERCIVSDDDVHQSGQGSHNGGCHSDSISARMLEDGESVVRWDGGGSRDARNASQYDLVDRFGQPGMVRGTSNGGHQSGIPVKNGHRMDSFHSNGVERSGILGQNRRSGRRIETTHGSGVDLSGIPGKNGHSMESSHINGTAVNVNQWQARVSTPVADGGTVYAVDAKLKKQLLDLASVPFQNAVDEVWRPAPISTLETVVTPVVTPVVEGVTAESHVGVIRRERGETAAAAVLQADDMVSNGLRRIVTPFHASASLNNVDSIDDYEGCRQSGILASMELGRVVTGAGHLEQNGSLGGRVSVDGRERAVRTGVFPGSDCVSDCDDARERAVTTQRFPASEHDSECDDGRERAVRTRSPLASGSASDCNKGLSTVRVQAGPVGMTPQHTNTHPLSHACAPSSSDAIAGSHSHPSPDTNVPTGSAPDAVKSACSLPVDTGVPITVASGAAGNCGANGDGVVGARVSGVHQNRDRDSVVCMAGEGFCTSGNTAVCSAENGRCHDAVELYEGAGGRLGCGEHPSDGDEREHILSSDGRKYTSDIHAPALHPSTERDTGLDLESTTSILSLSGRLPLLEEWLQVLLSASLSHAKTAHPKHLLSVLLVFQSLCPASQLSLFSHSVQQLFNFTATKLYRCSTTQLLTLLRLAVQLAIRPNSKWRDQMRIVSKHRLRQGAWEREQLHSAQALYFQLTERELLSQQHALDFEWQHRSKRERMKKDGNGASVVRISLVETPPRVKETMAYTESFPRVQGRLNGAQGPVSVHDLDGALQVV